MLSQQDAKNVIDQVISYSKLPENAEVSLSSTEDDFIRFANNGITTSGYRLVQNCYISSTTADKRSGSAAVSEFTPEALQRGVEQAEQLAAISRPDPGKHAGICLRKNIPASQPSKRLHGILARRRHRRSRIVKAVRWLALWKKQPGAQAGFIQRSASNAVGVGNKAGLFGYHTYTDSSMSHTMRNAEGTSSGWATQSSVSLKDLNGEEQAKVSIEKCLRGVNRKKLDPGKYTVIFEPAAVADLIGWLGFAFGARDAEQGQSFLSKPGGQGNSVGATFLGEKLFPEIITLRSDPFHPKLASTPWGPSLLPNEKISWIEKGIVKNLNYDRFWAQKAGKKPTPDTVNLVLDGQDNSLGDLIASVERGLLVTRLWYIRVVQPKTWQLTGASPAMAVFLDRQRQGDSDPVT